jgi:integrase
VEATFPPERQRVFGDIVKRRQVLALFGRIRDMAGLKGGTRTIRKSGATAVESQQAGAAAKFLGHKSPAMAIRHYVDPRLAKLQEGCQPPPLILPGEKEQGGAA